MFGVVNAVFSGLAFAGLLFALQLQRKELATQRDELGAQREELRLTRGVLARTAEAVELSQSALKDQVEAARRAARLAALTALIENYETRIRSATVVSRREAFEQTRSRYLGLLEDELKILSGETSATTEN